MTILPQPHNCCGLQAQTTIPQPAKTASWVCKCKHMKGGGKMCFPLHNQEKVLREELSLTFFLISSLSLRPCFSKAAYLKQDISRH